MLDPLPEINPTDRVHMMKVLENRDKINEIIAYLAVIASSLAPTPHLTGKQLCENAVQEQCDETMIEIIRDLPDTTKSEDKNA